MSNILTIAEFIELSQQLMTQTYGDMWQIRDDLTLLEQDYIRSLRAVQRIKNFSNKEVAK